MLNLSCKKDVARVTLTNFSPATEKSLTKKTIAIKTTEWLVYPYIGGPDEDSVYFSWSSYLGPYLKIDNVIIISKDQKQYDVQPGQQLSADSPSYFYQAGASLGDPTKILLWWIQKVPGTKPDADSAFFYLGF
jgi:hypothetical protein